MAHPGGRPLKFQTVEELEAKINNYFDSVPKEEWTWTGLALHLDTSRELLREYRERSEFVDSLNKALLKVENAYEIDLKKTGRTGTIFALKNFGWKDNQSIDHTTNGQNINNIQVEFITPQITDQVSGDIQSV